MPTSDQFSTPIDTETVRVIRTIKEEVLWVNDFGPFEEVRATIGAWIGEDYNRLYVHSALEGGYRSPEEFRQQWAPEAVLGECCEIWVESISSLVGQMVKMFFPD